MALVFNGSANTIAGLAVGGLPDGIVDTDMLAASAVTEPKSAVGVLQIVDASTGDAYSNTNDTFSDYTNANVAITPKRNNSKLLIVFDVYQNCRDADAEARGKIRIQEVITGGATTTVYYPNLNEGESNHGLIYKVAGSGTTDLDWWSPMCYSFTRSITSTSVHTYKFQGAIAQAGTTYYRCYGCRMSIMEIAQ